MIRISHILGKRLFFLLYLCIDCSPLTSRCFGYRTRGAYKNWVNFVRSKRNQQRKLEFVIKKVKMAGSQAAFSQWRAKASEFDVSWKKADRAVSALYHQLEHRAVFTWRKWAEDNAADEQYCRKAASRYLLGTQSTAWDQWMIRHEVLVLEDESNEKGEGLYRKRESRGSIRQWRGGCKRAREEEERFQKGETHWAKGLKMSSYSDWIKITRACKDYRDRVGTLGTRMVQRESLQVVLHWRARADAMIEQADMQEEGADWYVKRQRKMTWWTLQQWYTAVLAHIESQRAVFRRVFRHQLHNALQTWLGGHRNATTLKLRVTNFIRRFMGNQLASFWYLWKDLYREERSNLESLRASARYMRNLALASCFRHWLEWHKARQGVLDSMSGVFRRLESQKLSASFNTWLQEVRDRRREKNHKMKSLGKIVYHDLAAAWECLMDIVKEARRERRRMRHALGRFFFQVQT